MEAKEKDIEILREYTKREYAPIILLDRLVKSVQESGINENGSDKSCCRDRAWVASGPCT